MRRFLGVLLAVGLVVAGCGGSTPDGGGGGGGGDFPAGSVVIFGASYDPTSLAITGKVSTIKQGTTPLVAVGRAFTPRPPGEVVVQVGSGANNKPPRPVAASNNAENADLFAVDLSNDGLTPGTWVVAFANQSGRIFASGYLTVTP
jgi:hypothetical protein